MTQVWYVRLHRIHGHTIYGWWPTPGLGTDPSGIQPPLLSGWSMPTVAGATGGDGNASPCASCWGEVVVVVVVEVAAALVLVLLLLILFGWAWWSLRIISLAREKQGEDDARRRTSKVITIVIWGEAIAGWSAGAREMQRWALMGGCEQHGHIYRSEWSSPSSICGDKIAVSKWFFFRVFRR